MTAEPERCDATLATAEQRCALRTGHSGPHRFVVRRLITPWEDCDE